MEDDQLKQLIDVLSDKTSREDERSDAAMYLGRYYDLRAIDALMKVAENPNEDDTIIDDCAVSIAMIWIGMNKFDTGLFKKMTPFAQKIVLGLIRNQNPNLLSDLSLE